MIYRGKPLNNWNECCNSSDAIFIICHSLQLTPLVTELWIPARTSTLCGQWVDWEKLLSNTLLELKVCCLWMSEYTYNHISTLEQLFKTVCLNLINMHMQLAVILPFTWVEHLRTSAPVLNFSVEVVNPLGMNESLLEMMQHFWLRLAPLEMREDTWG